MKSDWSNRALDRQNFQFPYTTGFLPQSQDNVILNGSYRLYDCGLIEYDIIYRFGYNGQIKHDGYVVDQILCNNLKIKRSDLNSRYFLDDNSYEMFNNVNTDGKNFSLIGNTIQTNRNDFCNVYCAEIKFPKEFKDLNYMIFNTPILSQTTDNKSIINGTNSVTFTNKNKKSVTAVLITYPNTNGEYISGYNTQNGGLVANSFRCKIVGKTVIV